YDRGAGGAGRLQLAARHRSRPKTVAVRRRLLHQVPDLPESAVPPEMEGSVAIGAAAGLATRSGRAAMAEEPCGRNLGAGLRRAAHRACDGAPVTATTSADGAG